MHYALFSMKYFSIAELTASNTAKQRNIPNVPSDLSVRNLIMLVDNVLDPLREAYGKSIRVNSGYRSIALNKAIGGASSSQHMTGHAADISAGSRKENQKLFDLVQKLNLPFDQLIFEKGSLKEGPDWVHVSFDESRNRRQILYLV